MSKIIKHSFSWAFALSTGVFAFVPEEVFGRWHILKMLADRITMVWASCPLSSEEMAATFGRTAFLIGIFVISLIVNKFRFSKSVSLSKSGYSIRVEYGDLLKQNSWKKRKCLKVISFDECFTTTVGFAPGDIKPDSVCGQYLKEHPIENMQELIDAAGLTPCDEPSKYRNRPRYESGSLILRDDFLLMAFARLDDSGRGMFESREEYLSSLSKLWDELDKCYGQCHVCIPVLGSGLTRIGDVNPTQQELTDLIIYSYKLSSHKIKTCLRIICRKREGFSLTEIGETV